MAAFVHLAFETDVKSILRNGIALPKKVNGIFAMPVAKNFFVSHQWLRELKRRKQGIICAVYFRIRDDERVLVGHYHQEHKETSAAEALAFVSSKDDGQGFEVIIQRKIRNSEIFRIKRLPQVVGWRYFPKSHGRKPCGCPYCQCGEYGAKKLREKFEI